jgi:hypothetical protein
MAFWVDQEGALGDVTNLFSTRGGQMITWHVVSGNNKPNATAHGPYATRTIAQAEATMLNNVSHGSIAGQIGSAAIKDMVGNLNVAAVALRASEILLGIVLIGVGLAKLTGAENVVSKVAKNGLPIAAMG